MLGDEGYSVPLIAGKAFSSYQLLAYYSDSDQHHYAHHMSSKQFKDELIKITETELL